MKVLVIGGNGFIGSCLVARLRADCVDVRVADHGTPRAGFDWQGVEYWQVPLSSRSGMVSVLAGVDAVVHCASSTVPSTSNLDPIGDIQQNLIGTVNLLEAMREVGTRRIVYLSSGGTVYGQPTLVPVPETHDLNPISSYGVVKVAIEKYLLMYQELYGLEPVILRPSNPYGPGQVSSGIQGLIASFLGKIRDGNVLPVWGDGEAVRDYLYIDDLIDMLALAVRATGPGVYNVGSGQGHSVNEIIGVIREATGRVPEVESLEQRSFDVRRVVLDISRAREVFGWSPSVDMHEGILRTWEWIRQFSPPVK